MGDDGRVCLLYSVAIDTLTDAVCRYEFAQNEFVNALESVTLETLSTESGTKDFLAVGTTINRGEDLAVKGAVSAEIRCLQASS